MKKTTLAIALLASAQVLAQSCSDNPLLAEFGFPARATPLTGVSGLNYCKTLEETKTTCCSAQIINTFQDETDKLTDKLRDIVIARDQFLIKTRKDTLPGVIDSVDRFSAAAKEAMTKLQEMLDQAGAGAGSGDGAGAQAGDGEDSGDVGFDGMDAFEQMVKQVTDNIPELVANFPLYQKSRTQCVIEMVKLQAAAWCLACDPNWATSGVAANGRITMSNDVCTRLLGACYDFVDQSGQQNGILEVSYIAPLLDEFTTAFEAIAEGDLSGLAALEAAMTGDETDIPLPEDENHRPAEKPSDCVSADNCPFICDKIFTKEGRVNEGLLAAGGIIRGRGLEDGHEEGEREMEMETETEAPPAPEELPPPGARLLVSSARASQNNRALVANTWNAASDEAGVTATFEDNPGNVDNGTDDDETSSGVLMTGAVVCASALSMILLV